MPALSPAALVFSELIIEVFRVNGLALEAGDRLTRPASLTSARWQVLGVVDHGPAPVAHIARTMGLTRQSVQLTANALASAGFVQYAPNPHHRRAKLIAITASGRKALRRVEARQATWANRLSSGIGHRALRAARDGLMKTRLALEQDSASPGSRARRRR